MFLRHLTPMLATSSIQQTIDFYTSVLGFKVMGTLDHEGELGWCSLARDNVWLMFSRRENFNIEKESPVYLYFYPSNMLELWEQVKDRAIVENPPCKTEYDMHEFIIKDNNGYTLMFGQDLQPTTDFDKWFPHNLVLETKDVQLRVLKQSDVPQLEPLVTSDTTWKYFTKDLSSGQALDQWIAEAMYEYGNRRRVPFLIFDKKRNRPAGSTSFGNISFYDRRLEIGWSWLGDEFKGTGVNTNAKFLLLQYAFETLRFERVEIKTDNLNERSKAALKKIGASPEGVLRNHMQMHSDRRRHSIYFAVLKDEWEKVKQENFKNLQ